MGVRASESQAISVEKPAFGNGVRSKYSADPQVSIVQQVVTVTANRSQALVEPQCFPPLRLST